MRINLKIAQEVYEAMTPEQRKKAFIEMIDTLGNSDDQLIYNKNDKKVYWNNCGLELGA
jgi:hypothetical protein